MVSFDHLSLLAISLGFFVGLLFAFEVGRFLRARSKGAPGDREDDGFAMTSILGLLALLIGFTFSLALSRYDARRDLVVKEANAIGTTWLRTQLLDEPERSRMQSLLRRYVDTRVEFGTARTPDEELRRYQRTEDLQTQLWNLVIVATAPFRDTPRASLIVATTNDSIDLAAERFAVRQAHIPPRILRMLAIFAMLAAGMVGYERGHRRKAATLLFVLLTLAVTLVIDLDRPSTGITNVPQEPMLDLRRSMGE